MTRSPPSRCTVTGLLSQPQPHRRRAHRGRPGAAGLGLPHASLPHPHAHRAVGLRTDELHVHAVGEQRMPFDGRARCAGRSTAAGSSTTMTQCGLPTSTKVKRIGPPGGLQHRVHHALARRGAVPGRQVDVGAREAGPAHVHPHHAVARAGAGVMGPASVSTMNSSPAPRRRWPPGSGRRCGCRCRTSPTRCRRD